MDAFLETILAEWCLRSSERFVDWRCEHSIEIIGKLPPPGINQHGLIHDHGICIRFGMVVLCEVMRIVL
jgi:hypothetical protein